VVYHFIKTINGIFYLWHPKTPRPVGGAWKCKGMQEWTAGDFESIRE